MNFKKKKQFEFNEQVKPLKKNLRLISQYKILTLDHLINDHLEPLLEMIPYSL